MGMGIEMGEGTETDWGRASGSRPMSRSSLRAEAQRADAAQTRRIYEPENYFEIGDLIVIRDYPTCSACSAIFACTQRFMTNRGLRGGEKERNACVSEEMLERVT